MNMVVIGPGAMGLLFAARLSKAGERVSLLDHRAERAGAIGHNGVSLEDEGGAQRVAVPIGSDPAMLGQCDLALVCVKSYDTAPVADELAANLPPGARTLTLQNGAGNLEALQAALGHERVMGGITSEGATLAGPGRVRHAGRGQTSFGQGQGPPDGFCRRLAGVFNRAGFQAAASARVRDLIWSKLVVNVGINALTAVLGVPNGSLLKLTSAHELMTQAVEEALKVGSSLGVEWPHSDMPAQVRQVAMNTASNLSSMLQDVRNRKRTEVEFINGAVVRWGREQGVETPVNRCLAQMVSALEENYLQEV